MMSPAKRGNWSDDQCFYVTATDAGRLAHVLGPFRDKGMCSQYAYGDGRSEVTRLCERIDPKSVFYAFGMVQWENGYKEGILNQHIITYERDQARTAEVHPDAVKIDNPMKRNEEPCRSHARG